MSKTLRNVEILNEDETTQTALQNYSVKFERYTERQGGYTRILKVGPRRGDVSISYHRISRLIQDINTLTTYM